MCPFHQSVALIGSTTPARPRTVCRHCTLCTQPGRAPLEVWWRCRLAGRPVGWLWHPGGKNGPVLHMGPVHSPRALRGTRCEDFLCVNLGWVGVLGNGPSVSAPLKFKLKLKLKLELKCLGPGASAGG